MEYTRLGNTGLKVSRICVGTNMFGADYVDDARAVSVVNTAFEHGVNFIDTADAYNSGLSEHVVGKAIKGKRNDFVIGTKGFIATGSGANDVGLSRKHLIDAVEGSLRRLRVPNKMLFIVILSDSIYLYIFGLRFFGEEVRRRI